LFGAVLLEVETIKLTDGDAAFLLGKGGKTKAKIARVSCADLELFERDLILEIRGSGGVKAVVGLVGMGACAAPGGAFVV